MHHQTSKFTIKRLPFNYECVRKGIGNRHSSTLKGTN